MPNGYGFDFPTPPAGKRPAVSGYAAQVSPAHAAVQTPAGTIVGSTTGSGRATWFLDLTTTPPALATAWLLGALAAAGTGGAEVAFTLEYSRGAVLLAPRDHRYFLPAGAACQLISQAASAASWIVSVSDARGPGGQSSVYGQVPCRLTVLLRGLTL